MEENMNVDVVEKVNKSDKNMESIYDMASVVVSAILTVGIIFTFLFKISTVSGESMENTLHNGDKLIISAITQDVEYGDVVVTSQPNAYGKVLIKRVVAVGGQTVWFNEETNKVVVDGKELSEPYIKEEMEFLLSMTNLFKVPEGKVFVMGDNRNDSADSRDALIGMIDERYIVGKVVYRIGDKKLFNSDFKET
ncbi:MAG: signal peptidase I [Clostridia bacterium]|nr:signal peptidase I [Clostridia bacterium]